MNYQRFTSELDNESPFYNIQHTEVDGAFNFDNIDLTMASNQNNNFKSSELQIEMPGTGQTCIVNSGRSNNPPLNTPFRNLQKKVQAVVEHLIFRVVICLLILTDTGIVIAEIVLMETSANGNYIMLMQIISIVIVSCFLLELLTRIFYKGKMFFKNVLDILDMLVIVATFIMDIVMAAIHSYATSQYYRLVILFRVVRIIRIARCLYLAWTQHEQIAQSTRRVVSSNKMRYREDGFDLDLCYITERVIAMSFPSTGLRSLYRNPMKEVVRFLDTKHPEHYKVYNLCSEREYDQKMFHGRVSRIYIDDHNVPKLSDTLKFTENVREWMSKDSLNVIAVHCKGGKGRTGTMICLWLIDCGLFDQASESLEYFGLKRTDLTMGLKFQGVETPSQSRYVGYYEDIVKRLNCNLPPTKILVITTIKIHGIKGVGNGDGSDLILHVYSHGSSVFKSKFGAQINCSSSFDTENDCVTVNLTNCPELYDDVKIRLTSNSNKVPCGYENCVLFFWFHTSFIENNRLILTRSELDNPHKDKTWSTFKENFAIELMFRGNYDIRGVITGALEHCFSIH